MNTTRDLRRLFTLGVTRARHADLLRGKLGRYNGDETYTVQAPGSPYHVYVRIGDKGLVVARNFRVPNRPNLPVYLDKTPAGDYTVAGLIDDEAVEYGGLGGYGMGAGPHGHYLGSGLEDYIEAQRFIPGLLACTNPTSLSVTVAPFFYWYNHALVYFPGGTLDLTSYIPGTASTHAWVLVGVDPATNTLTATAGTAYSIVTPLRLAPNYVADIAFSSKYPCGAVILRNGQTTIADYRDFLDVRHYAAIGGVGEVLTAGDNMTGELIITVTTADENALTLKTSDNNTTNPLLLVTDSADTVQASIGPTGAVVLNEEGNDADFRVEGDAVTSLIHADASTDRVGINTATPAARLDVVGDTRLGDSATNYAAFAADGELTLAGTARVKRQVIFSGAVLATGTTPPAESILGNYPIYSFAINEDCMVTAPIPQDWASGTDMVILVRWAINEAYATNSGEVRWRADWSLTPADASESLDAPTHSGNDNSGDVNIPATAKTLMETAIETIVAANIAVGDQLGVKISRVALGDGNNPTAEPFVLMVVVEYTADKLGEAT